ncbi:MAG: GntR family transcriptional regulator [Lentisphaeria bacterium]|nr:GntR family transcriptional regulator [Lentisphaeria bacterium]
MQNRSGKKSSKSERLETLLREDIFTRRLADDQAITPELELAEKHGMSRNSVRRVISKLVAEGFLYRRRGSGTYIVPEEQRGQARPEAELPRGKRQVLFLSLETALSEAVFRGEDTFGPIFRGLSRVLQPRGYNLLIANVGLDWEVPACLLNGDVAGVIFHGEVEPGFWRRHIAALPCVGLQHVNRELDCDWVKQDNEQRCYEAIRYLKRHGHQRIGFVSNEAETFLSRERQLGYRLALRTFDLPHDPAWEVVWQRPRVKGVLLGESEIPDYSPYLQKAFETATTPSAFLCLDNWRAMGSLLALHKMGLKVPEDISLIGSYNFPNVNATLLNGKTCHFTHFNDNLEDICAAAAGLLLEQIACNKKQARRTISVQAELIEGDTVMSLRTEKTNKTL